MISVQCFLINACLHWGSIIALPQSSDGGGIDLTIPGIIEGVGDGIENTINFFKDLQIPSSESSAPLKNPDISLPSEAPVTAPGLIRDAKPSTTKKCDSAKDDDCQTKVAMNVFAKDCSDQVQNDALTYDLNQMVEGPNGVYITEFHGCGVKFWTVHLTPRQANEIKTKDAVRGIALDKPIVTNHPPPSEDLDEDKSTKFRKRDEIVSRANRRRDLAFYSTPPYENLEQQFSYFASAGQGITVYLMDLGADRFHIELSRVKSDDGGKFTKQSIISYWLYAKDTLVRDIDEDGHGSCMLSKIAGLYLGLASNANIVIAKIILEQSSMLNGLWQVVNHLVFRKSQGEETEGYSVLNIQHAWPDEGTENEAALKEVISVLSKTYKVVVVVPAGYDEGRLDAHDIDTVPAKFSQDLPIITVGAVSQFNGWRLPWSPSGPALTVSAPGVVFCAKLSQWNRETVQVSGTDVAAAGVAGMVAGMLASPGLGGKLRGYYDIPKAVRDWVVAKSWVRPGAGLNAVWNGITPGRPDLWDP